MKKDLRSYKKHDEAYEYENTLEVIKKYDNQNLFSKLGFELAFKITKILPDTHIDIGSGTGWLLRKTSPIFKKVIGVEPSLKAIKLAESVTKEFNNIYFINEDMVDALQKEKITTPVFLTTATVLNHIENYYVEEFLKTVNDLPNESILFFDERYDENINWKLWHIRTKDWWRDRLTNWQIIFLDIDIDGYSSGIYGIKSEKILKTRKIDNLGKLFMKINKVKNLFGRLIKKIK